MKLLVLAGEKAERLMAIALVNIPVRRCGVRRNLVLGGMQATPSQRGRRSEPGRLHTPSSPSNVTARSFSTLPLASVTKGPQTYSSKACATQRARTKFQISTDGFAPYKSAIVTTLHDRITGYAQMIKVYRTPQDGEKRYSPAEVSSVEVVRVFGDPDPDRICSLEHRGAIQSQPSHGHSAASHG